MTIQYDAGDLSGWVGLPRLFLRLRGTIIVSTITGPLFWITNLTHIAFLFIGGQIKIREERTIGYENVTLEDASGDPYVEEYALTGWFTSFEGIVLSDPNHKVCYRCGPPASCRGSAAAANARAARLGRQRTAAGVHHA